MYLEGLSEGTDSAVLNKYFNYKQYSTRTKKENWGGSLYILLSGVPSGVAPQMAPQMSQNLDSPPQFSFFIF